MLLRRIAYPPLSRWPPLLWCKEVEDENDDENENDWGSGGGEPSIAGIVCRESDRSIGSALLQDARPFPYRVPACFIPSQIVLVLRRRSVLGLWLEGAQREDRE